MRIPFSFSRRAIQAIAASAVLLAMSTPSFAQLVPDHLYNGVNRPIPMHVSAKGSGVIEIALLRPVTAEVVDSATAERGALDLSSLFPGLWTTTNPSLLYAQLLVDGKKIGPAVVLQPMSTPEYAMDLMLTAAIIEAFDNGDRDRLIQLLDPRHPARRGVGRSAQITFPPLRESTFTGYRAYTDRHVLFNTSEGDIEIALRPDQAPNTCFNFIHLAENHFYDDIRIDRVVADPKFLIQFGDPSGTKKGGPGYSIAMENSSLKHRFGVVSMARDPASIDTAGSQLFISLDQKTGSRLDGKYTAFGVVVRGAKTLLAIENTELGGKAKDKPLDPLIISAGSTVPAPPYGEGPKPVVRPKAKGDDR